MSLLAVHHVAIGEKNFLLARTSHHYGYPVCLKTGLLALTVDRLTSRQPRMRWTSSTWNPGMWTAYLNHAADAEASGRRGWSALHPACYIVNIYNQAGVAGRSLAVFKRTR